MTNCETYNRVRTMSDITYHLYLGDAVQTVSLWRREGNTEHPIYANTRGQCEWFTFNAGDCENTTPHALSDALVEWLAEMHRRIECVGDMTPNRELPELEWYETEVINAIANPAVTEEQFELMEWAYEEVQDK